MILDGDMESFKGIIGTLRTPSVSSRHSQDHSPNLPEVLLPSRTSNMLTTPFSCSIWSFSVPVVSRSCSRRHLPLWCLCHSQALCISGGGCRPTFPSWWSLLCSCWRSKLGFPCSFIVEEESSEHAERWCPVDVYLKVLIFRIKNKFALSDSFRLEVPNECVIDNASLRVFTFLIILCGIAMHY